MISSNFTDEYNDRNYSKTLSIKLDFNTLAKIDFLVKRYKFSSRSDFVRSAIMYKLNKIKEGKL